ncbi:MAG: hypothetical protein ACXIVG_08070 [Pararhodobacter sp.]
MRDRTDNQPEGRRARIDAARAILRAPSDAARLHEACMVLLAESDDPLDRTLASAFLDSDAD